MQGKGIVLQKVVNALKESHQLLARAEEEGRIINSSSITVYHILQGRHYLSGCESAQSLMSLFTVLVRVL